MSVTGKIALFFCFVSSAWLDTQTALAGISDDMIYTMHPELLDKCLGEGKTEPDYTLNPYYLRLDLDGDGGMDFVTFVANDSGSFRLHSVEPNVESKKFEPVVARSLLVCFSNGMKVLYRGLADRKSNKHRPPQHKKSGRDERPQPTTTGAGPAARQSGKDSGDVDSAYDESFIRPWVAEDKVLTRRESSEENTAEIMFSWYPLSKSEARETIDYYDVPMDSGKILGEAIGAGFDVSETLGFWDGKQFRWLVLSVANGKLQKQRKRQE